jgi:acyl-coenzyme A synthetase/AMP-(fatty) acid ligase
MPTYEDAREEYRVEVPESFNFADDIIDAHASQRDKLALLWVDDSGTTIERLFSDVAQRSRKLANGLVGLGLKRGDTAIVVLGRELEWWESLTGLIRVGAVVSPGTTQLAPNDIAYRVKTSQANCIVTNVAGAEKFDVVAGECGSVTIKVLVGGSREG